LAVDIVVMKAVNADNEASAQQVRMKLDAARVTGLNVMSSPGSGKTTLLEATIKRMRGELRFAVIEGDVFTAADAERIAGHGVQVVQLNTEGSCHLTAHMISEVLPRIDLEDVDFLVIENIGNLICPASFSLGEHFKLACLSTPEGTDKPQKYPRLFSISQLNIITKADMAGLAGFDIECASQWLHKLNPTAPVITTSARTGDGMAEWIQWLRSVHGGQVLPSA
jgi:hydrogenase nickel incorporation protein HypB